VTATSTRAVWLAILLALAASAIQVQSARADGDPASDVLVSHTFFMPADANASGRQQRDLAALLAAADRAGLPIRVAVIPSDYDLGSITELWQKPHIYADFLGVELANSFKSALLVVMPNGFGLHWTGHATASAERLLSAIKISPGSDGLLNATEAGVRALAAAEGITLAASADRPAATTASGGIPTIAIFIVIAWALGVVAFLLFRRRRTRPSERGPASRTIRKRITTAVSERAVARLAVIEATVLFVAIAVGAVLVATKVLNGGAGTPTASAATAPFSFPADRRKAPAFELTGQNGQPVSLGAYRGKPVIVTFIDPLCRNLCPLAAHVLNAVDRELPAAQRVPIIAVSVDVYADTHADLLEDFQRWSLVPQWHWAVGTPTQLAAVWSRYEVGVSVVTKRIAGITVHYIEHDELAYVVDPDGYERALFFWPYDAAGVKRTLAQLTRA
jgi:cytochrome oxidase Cu insertion factor (SCO1/SenC/PrrC family)